jgi:class 3 adenylate cyclase/tetratricopeptide (TPR) repeat protein
MIRCPSCGEENPPKFKLCGYCGTPLAAVAPALPAHEVRKTVTLIFTDLKDSTALGERLDSEALHEVKERYFKAMAAEIARHGGKIEKYIGDAIMAVFGLPRAHEDDALRAVRAAAGMRAVLAQVNEDLSARFGVVLANRTGVNTGEVVASDDPTADQKLATGDAVNVTARLEAAAPANEILIGEMTWRLVRDAVDAEAVEPLTLKGKTQPVPAWRLIAVRGVDGNGRRIDTPIVGRDEELAALERVYREVTDGHAARLVTVIGDAGVGKSRLVHEVVTRIASDARVLRGRCLAYGDGITFWPLRLMIGAAADLRDSDAPDAAHAKLQALIGERDIADRLASAAGLSSAQFPLPEVYWAARKFLETLAAERPVVALIDDIHWAEPAFLDLIEHVLDTASGARILLLATARPDLLDAHPQWGERAASLRQPLRPLTDAAAAQIVASLLGSADLPGDVVARIVGAAEGNPLYVEQMLSMMIDSGALREVEGRWQRADAGGEIVVPPTIHALLEARLDQLGREERATVEPASVIGLEFAQIAVASLAPEAVRTTVDRHLTTLTSKQFIALSRAVEAEPIYRFQHQLVRDTVYGGLLKRARARLHLEFVRWADRVNADRDRALEFEEILGYHLEQAHRYLRELGTLDAQGIAVGRDAARRLSNAAKRAFARGDLHAATNFYRRAIALLSPEESQRAQLLPEFAEALMGLGDFPGARAAIEEAKQAAVRIADRRIGAASQLMEIFVGLYGTDRGERGEETLRQAHALIPVLEGEDAYNELAATWRLIGLVHGIAGRYGDVGAAAGRALEFARRAENDRLVARIGGLLANTALFGPMTVPQAIAQCQALLADGLSDRQVECNVMCLLAQLRAMNGELEEARALYRRARAVLNDLGQGVLAASTGIDVALVELLGGDLALAEREVRRDYEFLADKGEAFYLSTISALLARIVRDQGRDAEALSLSMIAEERSLDDDIDSQSRWRAIRAPIVARGGDLAQAEALARAAVELASRTEAPALQADALSELASVMMIAGRHEDSRRAIGDARALYQSKGNIVAAARCLAALDGVPARGDAVRG